MSVTGFVHVVYQCVVCVCCVVCVVHVYNCMYNSLGSPVEVAICEIETMGIALNVTRKFALVDILHHNDI